MPPLGDIDFRQLYAEPLGSGFTTGNRNFVVIGNDAYYDYGSIRKIEAKMRAEGSVGEIDEAGCILGMNIVPPLVRMYTVRRGDDTEITERTIAMFQKVAGEHVLFERRPHLQYKTIAELIVSRTS